ncbi:MAG: ABC transporter ATP-binding protein [Thauera sp.]|nr:ABC transporter ATP-binding protein [Thauera sp.]
MLKIQSLAKTLPGPPPRRLFEDLALDIASGECVAIVGESGAGKSTLLNCIAGLDGVAGGSIRVRGTEICGLDDDALARLRREHFGFVFQAFHVLPHLSLADNVAVPLWLLGVQDRVARVRALDMLARVGLAARADDPPRLMSGGELQRVAIARALVHRPAVVLADEPTGNLDPERAASVLDLLLDTIRDAGAAGVLVTHSRAAARRADRVLALEQGRLVDIRLAE